MKSAASKARQKKNMKVRQTTHATARCVFGVVGPLNQSYSGGSDGDGGGYILDVVVLPRFRRGAHPWGDAGLSSDLKSAREKISQNYIF